MHFAPLRPSWLDFVDEILIFLRRRRCSHWHHDVHEDVCRQIRLHVVHHSSLCCGSCWLGVLLSELVNGSVAAH